MSSRHPRPLVRVLAFGGAIGSFGIIVLGGSIQGLVGLAVVILVQALCWSARLPPGVRVVLGAAAASIVLISVFPLIQLVATHPDFRTLSGRTPLYGAAVQEIMKNPWVGTGHQHVYTLGAFDRAAHSAVLGLAVTGGVLIGLAWLALLGGLVASSYRLLSAGRVIAAAPIVFVTLQFVQSVQLLPVAWVVIVLFFRGRVGEEVSYGADARELAKS